MGTSTHKQLETHGCVRSIIATDAQVLKHQDIDIHSVEQILNVLNQFHSELLQLYGVIHSGIEVNPC